MKLLFFVAVVVVEENKAALNLIKSKKANASGCACKNIILLVSRRGGGIGREVLRRAARVPTRQRVIMSIKYGKFGSQCMCEMARARMCASYNHDDDDDDEGKSINKQNQFKRDLSELSFYIPGCTATVPGPVVVRCHLAVHSSPSCQILNDARRSGTRIM